MTEGTDRSVLPVERQVARPDGPSHARRVGGSTILHS